MTLYVDEYIEKYTDMYVWRAKFLKFDQTLAQKYFCSGPRWICSPLIDVWQQVFIESYRSEQVLILCIWCNEGWGVSPTGK